jgi:hypothetical protein
VWVVVKTTPEGLKCDGYRLVEVLGRVTTQLFEPGTLCEDMMGGFEGNAAKTAPWLAAVVQSGVEVNG